MGSNEHLLLILFWRQGTLKKLQRAKKYLLFFPRVLLLYYSFPIELGQEKKKHHCREVYIVSRWQGSGTKTKSTFTNALLSTSNEHHYVLSPNLFIEDFSDIKDTSSRPPIVFAPEVAFSSQNPVASFHFSTSFFSTPNIGPLSFASYIHISTKAFKQLLGRLDMIQENQANIKQTQQ